MFDWEASGLACSTQAAITPTDKARRPIIITVQAPLARFKDAPERSLSYVRSEFPLSGLLRPTRAIVPEGRRVLVSQRQVPAAPWLLFRCCRFGARGSIAMP